MPLSSLRAGEGVRLELRSAELHKLLSHAAGLYRLYKREGLPRGETHFLKVSASGPAGDAGRLSEWLKRAGPGADAALLEWLTDAGPESPLARLAPADLARLDRLAGVNALRQLLQLWESNQENTDEAFWQRRLGEYDFLLAWLFACPMVLFASKAYVGGKNLHDLGGHEADSLLAHPHTGNAGPFEATLVEIKTPATRLLGGLYRGGVYGASADLSGAIAQVLTDRQSLLRQGDALTGPEGGRLQVHCPRCLVLIGHMGRELGDDSERARSFELFRGALAGDLVVLTFDELFRKAQALLEYLNGSAQGRSTAGPPPAATPSG